MIVAKSVHNNKKYPISNIFEIGYFLLYIIFLIISMILSHNRLYYFVILSKYKKLSSDFIKLNRLLI